jgi:thioesterase domain-containing protein
MRAVEIPFVSHVGIEEQTSDRLQLSLTQQVHNHVGTMHAAALFALAETQSGVFLQQLFPEYGVDEVMPLLRGSIVKYRSPATTTISATASVELEAQEKFLSQFERRGRAGITVNVKLSDSEGTVVMSGEFAWFVQRR